MLAFASALVSLYWLAGGTLLLDTVGGAIERLGRERSAGALGLAAAAALLKILAGVLALALARDRRGAGRGGRLAAFAAGAVLSAYGAVLVAVGALVLAGVVNPSGEVDEHALRRHVFLWDPWFLVWGLALLAAATRARRRSLAR